MAINTNASGVAREALLKAAPPAVNMSGVAREALLLGAPSNVNVSAAVREVLQTPNAAPSPFATLVSGVARETLQSAILFVHTAGTTREVLVKLPPSILLVSGVARETLLPGTSAITRVVGWRLGW